MTTSDHSNYKDNLKSYREEKVKVNKHLVKRAIEQIVSLNGELSLNNVSKMTFAIADPIENEKGLSPSTLSKNSSYKSLIDEAKYNQKRKVRTNKKAFIPNGSMADIKLKNFELISINNKLKTELDSYKYVLKNYSGNISIEDIKKHKELKDYKLLIQVARGLVQRILETELAMIDDETNELVVAPYGDDILLSKKALNFILEEEE